MQIGEADRHGERAVLGQVEILARHRRHDDAQRLRQHDEAQREAAAQAQRHRRLALSPAHGEDAGAHDLRDEGAGIDDQADEKGDKFGRDDVTAREVEAAQLGLVELERHAADDEDEKRQPDDERGVGLEDRELLAGRHLPRARPARDEDADDDTEHEGGAHP